MEVALGIVLIVAATGFLVGTLLIGKLRPLPHEDDE